MHHNSYKKFAFTLLISLLIMYVVMFLNVDYTSHIYLSLTRLYMSLLMVSPMALLMLGTMGGMYPNKKLNSVISASALAVFVLALVCLRRQVFISDVQYMKAMIPHHSSAILTSKNAAIKNAEVKELSISIIQSQEREIQQMKNALERMD